MSRTKITIITVSIILSLLIVGGALVAGRNRQTAQNNSGEGQSGGTTQEQEGAKPREQRTVSKAELAAATGKDGKTCLVAVDGTVYEIKDFSLWQNGEHTTSNGQAYCGADMTAVIEKSPHGRRILDVLVKVGPLQG